MERSKKINLSIRVKKLLKFILNNFVIIFILGIQVYIVTILWYYYYTGIIALKNGESISGNVLSVIFIVAFVNLVLYGMYYDATTNRNYINPSRQDRNFYYNDCKRYKEYNTEWVEKRDNGGLTNIEVIKRKKRIREKINNYYKN